MSQVIERIAIKHKAEEVEKTVHLIDKYDVIAMANLYKIRAKQLQELAKRFRSKIFMKVAKNIIIKKAIEKSKKKNIKQLVQHTSGSTILLFTQINPFSLSMLLNRNPINVSAKAGDFAQNDIVIPAGNTGLPPGPAISELHAAGIRTKIEAGSVWVSKETVVAKKGEEIQSKTAIVLSKLGIKPLTVSLQLKAAYYDELIFTTDQLAINIDKIKKQCGKAHTLAQNLSINLGYPTTETIETILLRAHFSSKTLAIRSAYLATGVESDILLKAYNQMTILALQLAKINKEVAPKDFSSKKS